MAVTLFTMILVRDAVRTVELAGKLEPVTRVAPQWGAIAVFFVLLLAAVATVAGMVWALAATWHK